MSSDPRFDEPPVREVALTIFFDRVPTMQAINLARLRVQWIKEYPKVSEVPPRPPIRGEHSFAEFLGSNSFWPMPFTAFTSVRGDRAIQVQNDRFGIVWRFDHSRKMYPGFEVLSQELFRRFDEFRAALVEELEQAVHPTDVELEYNNLIEGYRPEDLATGILTGWSVRRSSPGPADVAGLRLHYCSDIGEAQVPFTVSIDPTFDQDLDSLTCYLELNATLDVSGGGDIEEAMRSGHTVIVNKFVELSNDDMKKQWGAHQ